MSNAIHTRRKGRSGWISSALSHHPSHPRGQQKSSTHAGRRRPGVSQEHCGNSVLEKLQSSYLLHIHCFVAEICLIWSLGCSNHLLLIHRLREALKREGKPCGEPPLADSAEDGDACSTHGYSQSELLPAKQIWRNFW